ncbi:MULTISPECIES: hypothetical protein [Halobacteriovorax]|uniref:Uncharacterized protein n=1 Tax=Halobacteriovorax vibrionivorans TaxID=2152716 RepID=A0ABY0IK30_9BACT|nr:MULTISPECIES: hypothetical protein [Halobacteriovorax]AYF43522.1 hypothetical protein BALOs_0510 [Halobacteriovorax sp. BALOs_7]RZF21909.1 hypothetical protein DAY19_09470 [Halobacteriovorax vibrionivorans]TGD45901.1 hypothetical protein EP118_14205 [Halobacteriovorax sp. Y22]
MAKKLIKLFTVVSLLSILSGSVMANSFGHNEEFELFDRLKTDMWQMGLDFEYVQTADLNSPTHGMMQDGEIQQEVAQQMSAVKSVPYDLIHAFERSF